eukprot:TRINITY_DN4474_c0_g1_i1.p2 TRINITY_DN4474_c0_g1~~TRINITY_DN4474_c0_g1_i1.p2  ORF type:complete len:142 (-),score=22.46 TRINITY_DN4474_c0_g1_i1:586-1011(-)
MSRNKVKSACKPCRKAHAKCSEYRPCERCISQGIEDQCDMLVQPGSSKPVYPNANYTRTEYIHNGVLYQDDGELGVGYSYRLPHALDNMGYIFESSVSNVDIVDNFDESSGGLGGVEHETSSFDDMYSNFIWEKVKRKKIN